MTLARALRSLALSLPLSLALCSASWCVATPQAHADQSKDQARKLFGEGVALAQKGNHRDALEKLLAAEALFHAPTHLLFIARSQNETGQLLEARATYEKLASEKLPPKASKPFLEAQEKGKDELEELERRIPRLAVVVTPEDAAGLVVTLGDRRLEPKELAEPFPVNPGSYEIKVVATGYAAATGKLVAELGRTSELRLALQPEGSDATKGISTSTRETDLASRSEGLNVASITMMAVGGAGLAAGGVFGALALVTQSDADELFETCGVSCRAETEDKDAQAAVFGNVAIISLAAGGAVFGTGLVLFLVNGGADGQETAALRLDAAPGYVGLSGSF